MVNAQERAHKGIFHLMSSKHLERHVREFSGKHNIRDLDTINQMIAITRGIVGKRLQYEELVECDYNIQPNCSAI